MSRTTKLLIMVSVAVLVVPVVAVASHQFKDVPASNIFHDDIAWLADNGITKGCNPPASDAYCPSDNVTRQQMSAFLHRLATSQAVDAGTVEGMTATELKGQQGATGAPGADGSDGASGADGSDGAPGADGSDGAPGADGSDGAIGAPGAPGADGVTRFYRVVTATPVLAGSGTVVAACEPDDVVTGGGFETTTTGADVHSSEPALDSSEWQVSYTVTDPDTVSAYAICADITP